MRSTHLVVALLATVLAAASFSLAAPDRASAGPGLCKTGEFCIWEHAGYKGGMFDSFRSDPSLYEDFFFKTKRPVANQGSAIYNNGARDVRDDVIVYDLTHIEGETLCIHRGHKIPDLSDPRYATRDGGDWNDNIVRYRWVTDRECARASSQA